MSAFREKFDNRNAPVNAFYKQMVAKILLQVNKTSDTAQGTDNNVTFTDFLSYIFSSNHLLTDIHWDTIENLCSPCLLDYDFIGTKETFDQDASYLLSSVFHTNQRIPLIGWQTGTNDSVAMQFYSDLPTHLRAKTIDYYTRDATLFNYKLDKYM